MSGNQHELFMMALTAVLSVIVSFFAGRIWEAWRAIDINNEATELSREEMALIGADRLRREREQPALRKTAVAGGSYALDSGLFLARGRTANER
jgi:hypothetical protein